MDHSDLMSLCKGFEYEKVPQGDFVFQKGDVSNNKLYVILSGKVGIIIPRDEQAPSPLLLRSLRSNILRKQGSKKKLTRMKDIQESALNKVTFKEPETDSLEDKSRSPKGKAGLMKLRSIAGPLSFMYQKEDTSKKIDYIEEKTKEDVTLSNRTMVARNEEVNEEEENLSGLADAQKFEEYAKIFGNLVRCFEMGESFGELALKNDAPRAASVLCSTDCEFLVITKQQFNLIFLKKDREKEIFLKSIFPFIDSTSTINYNSILYSFQVTLPQMFKLNV